MYKLWILSTLLYGNKYLQKSKISTIYSKAYGMSELRWTGICQVRKQLLNYNLIISNNANCTNIYVRNFNQSFMFSDSTGFYNFCHNWPVHINSYCWKSYLRNTYWRGKGVYLSNTMSVCDILTLHLISYFINR